MSDRFSVANAPEKDISEMDFKELRNKVQSLNDAFNLAMRKLLDTTENLDESNFSSGFLLKQKNMKAQLEATAERVKLTMTAEDLEGTLLNYSTIAQTASEIQLAVTAVKDYTTSLIDVAINDITLTVSNGAKSSILTLTAGNTVLSSQAITLAGDVVFKSDLETEGATVINGSNITTGTISAMDLSACNVKGSTYTTLLAGDGTVGGEIKMCYIGYINTVGGIRLDDEGAGTADEGQYRMFIYTRRVGGVPFHMKLESGGSMSLEAYNSVYISGESANITASDIYLNGNVYINGTKIG